MTTRTPTQIEDYLVTARSLDEYRDMFGLTDADLDGRRILDCPGGAASFAAEASGLGADVLSVDPAYATVPGDLCVRALDDAALGARYLHEHRDGYDWTRFGSPEGHYAARVRAVGLFGTDRRASPERYCAAALPMLPFADGSFDLVLSANLLFTYDDRLSAEWHIGAARELVRVGRGDVRIFPLLGYGGHLSPVVDVVIQAMAADGVDAQITPVAYVFQRGASSVLLLRGK